MFLVSKIKFVANVWILEHLQAYYLIKKYGYNYIPQKSVIHVMYDVITANQRLLCPNIWFDTTI